jgi:inner membrane protein
MENLTHSLVGVTAAKAGLDRLSPYATIVCLASANAADADFVTLFFGDRWTLLQHHRGITHSIVGTIAIGALVPILAVFIERIVATVTRHNARIQFRGLLIASMIAAATHPLMDWTNNYGVRPLLPWTGRWFYGDLVFIVDPYLWLVLAGGMFLMTSTSKVRTVAWAVFAAMVMTVLIVASRNRDSTPAVKAALAFWVVGVVMLATFRFLGFQKRLGRAIAVMALLFVVSYWSVLALMHHSAYQRALTAANQVAASRGERFVKVAAMPTAATPFTWQCVAETDRAMYRFVVNGDDSSSWHRLEKLTGPPAQLLSLAERDRRAQILLGFSRFPIARVDSDNCVGQTLVQFADLRYTEPGSGRGNFSVNIPVDCPSK